MPPVQPIGDSHEPSIIHLTRHGRFRGLANPGTEVRVNIREQLYSAHNG